MALIIAVYVFKRFPSTQMVYVSSKLLLINRLIMLEMDDQKITDFPLTSINFTGERAHLVT